MPRRVATMAHTLKLSDTVYQRVNPWQTGTVSNVQHGKSFTVTYHDRERKPGEPRTRHTYPWSRVGDFLVGTPPEEFRPLPVHTDAFGG